MQRHAHPQLRLAKAAHAHRHLIFGKQNRVEDLNLDHTQNWRFSGEESDRLELGRGLAVTPFIPRAEGDSAYGQHSSSDKQLSQITLMHCANDSRPHQHETVKPYLNVDSKA